MKQTLIIFFCLVSITGYGQIKSIGSPHIQNFPKSEYNAGTQNWDVEQDHNQFMFFANNQGVLTYDGVHWELIEIISSRPTRAVLCSSENKNYVGFFNDFGTLEPRENGSLTFHSLRSLLPEDILHFDDVWNIFELENEIVFQSYDYLFILKDDTIKVIQPQNRFHFSFKVGNRLYVQEPEVGLFEYTNDSLILAEWSLELRTKEITSILAAPFNKLLICTLGSGVYILENDRIQTWDSPVNQELTEDKIYSAEIIVGEHMAFGTILNGLYITDSEGKLVKHINKQSGLQNNTILSICNDDAGNLWLGLDNGIDYVEINSPISYIRAEDMLGSGYSSIVFEDKIYLGTNTGLFVKSMQDFENNRGEFRLVENTGGQVWSLDIFDGNLLCCHNSGTFQIEGERGIQISDVPGAWKYIGLKNQPDKLIGGHFNGLVILKKEGKQWKFLKKVKGYETSSRFLVHDAEGDIWISHGAIGIMKLSLDETYDTILSQEIFTAENGLPSSERNIAFEYQNEVLVSSTAGLFVFDKGRNSFLKSGSLETKFRFNGRLMRFTQMVNGDIWFVTKEEAGVLRLNEDNSYTKIMNPLMSLVEKFVVEFECLYPYNNRHIFIGIDDGFAHYAPGLPKVYDLPYVSYITGIDIASIDSIIKPLASRPDQLKIPYRKNQIRFSFAAPVFENQNQLQYSYYLENYSDEWSDWSPLTYKEFSNLYEGDYTFHVKARNIYGTESTSDSFEFTIVPPWQRSKAAFYSYIFLFLLFILLLVLFIRKRIEISRQKERAEHEEELRRKEEELENQKIIAEKEIIRLRNDKLTAEMGHRDKELANQTMNIIQKNRLLKKLKDELDLILESSKNPEVKTKLLVISRILNKEIDNKKQNQIFETYFEAVHDKFFEVLKEKHPKLSPRDCYLCAYIKMNLSSKEIASLLNISSRGVEISRYRLRKKLDLEREENLSVYLSNL